MYFDLLVLPDLLDLSDFLSIDAVHSFNSRNECGPETKPASVQVSSQTLAGIHTSILSESPKLPVYPKTLAK